MANAAYEALTAKVEALKAELPGISLGYLGNYERWGNDTQWYIFLPHFGRVGSYSDQFSLGPGKQENIFEAALASWDTIEPKLRKQYAADPNRIGKVYFKKYEDAQTGLLVDFNGTPLGLGQNPPPRFESAEKAAEYLNHYNYPAVLVGA
jgi:hypothetical protein